MKKEPRCNTSRQPHRNNNPGGSKLRLRAEGSEMIPYAKAVEVEAALGRNMTWSEAAWFRYSAATPDYCLYCHNVVILLVVYTLAPLPLALLELRAPPKLTSPYKLQPRVRLSPAEFLRCYKDTARVLLLTVGALQLVSYPAVKVII